MQVIIASPWIPAEWIAAHGHETKGVWLASPNAAAIVSEGVCPVAQAMAEFALRHSQAAFIFPSSCDQMRRAADAAYAPAGCRIFLFNMPATWQTPTARMLFVEEVKRLGRFLVDLGGRSPSASELAQTTERFNQARTQLQEYLHKHSGRVHREAMAAFFDLSLATDLAQPSPRSDELTPIALVGGRIFAPEWPLFDALCAAGGEVVVNAVEPGERCLLPPVPVASRGLTVESLAEHYFRNIVDVFRRPNSQLYSWLAPRLKGRKVRAIILWLRVGCDLWRAEAATLRERFGLPVLVLDSHRVEGFTSATPCPRDVNRIAAFIESLQ